MTTHQMAVCFTPLPESVFESVPVSNRGMGEPARFSRPDQHRWDRTHHADSTRMLVSPQLDLHIAAHPPQRMRKPVTSGLNQDILAVSARDAEGPCDRYEDRKRAYKDTAVSCGHQGITFVPMVLEARGLDVTPNMIQVFKSAKATQAVDALEVIYAEEVAHVAYGSKWFHFLCGRHELDPKEAFHDLVRTYFHGVLKPPFNEEKRAEAGIPPDFYWPLTESV